MKRHHLIAFLILSAGIFIYAQDAAPADGSASVDTPPEAIPATETPAADQPPAAEEDGPAIPVAHEAARYDSVWEKNPFTRKVAPPTTIVPDWGQDWALAGMFQYKGNIRVTIRNKQTNEVKRVNNEPKEGDEFRLVKATFNRSKKNASAEIAKGSQTATLKFDENAAPVTINNTARPAGAVQGVPGKVLPGQVGGQPVLTKPVNPTANGRVFNATNLPGGVSQGGMVPGGVGGMTNGAPNTSGQMIQPGIVNPSIPGTAGLPNNGGNVPTISRRRQLIPAPVVSPQNNP